MGDEYDTFALLSEELKKGKKPLGFLRGKDRGRFIEDEVPDIPEQQGEDRSFLPLAYGKLRSIPVQGQLKPPTVRKGTNRVTSLPGMQNPE
jgi:hypothetical protein